MKYFPYEILQAGITADADVLQRELTRASERLNGDIGPLELGDGTATANTLADNACNDIHIDANPFGSGTFTLQIKDIVGRDWVYPPGTQTTFTSDEGVIVGSLDISPRNFGQTVSDITYGYSIGVFLDGSLIGAIDRNTIQGCGVSIPFSRPIVKGNHRLSIGVKTYAYTASTAGNPDDVLVLYNSMLAWRIAKR